MKITSIRSIKLVETIQYVLTSVAMHDIKQHIDSHAMRCIYQFFQLIWRAVTAESITLADEI